MLSKDLWRDLSQKTKDFTQFFHLINHGCLYSMQISWHAVGYMLPEGKGSLLRYNGVTGFWIFHAAGVKKACFEVQITPPPLFQGETAFFQLFQNMVSMFRISPSPHERFKLQFIKFSKHLIRVVVYLGNHHFHRGFSSQLLLPTFSNNFRVTSLFEIRYPPPQKKLSSEISAQIVREQTFSCTYTS
jgi:hypothetical protein